MHAGLYACMYVRMFEVLNSQTRWKMAAVVDFHVTETRTHQLMSPRLGHVNLYNSRHLPPRTTVFR